MIAAYKLAERIYEIELVAICNATGVRNAEKLPTFAQLPSSVRAELEARAKELIDVCGLTEKSR